MSLIKNLKKIIKTGIWLFQMPINYAYCWVNGITFDRSWRFFGLPKFYTAYGQGKIEIGKNFTARSTIRSNSIGVFQPVILKSGPGALLKLGSNVGISGSTISASLKISIGDNVLIGSGCLISDSDAHPVNPIARMQNPNLGAECSPIIIEEHVFIGARAIILKGVTIGKGSTIGAGSVVSREVPPYCVVAGNPAKIIKYFENQALK